ncbi:MAG: ATP-grasp domain-containing protein [archaeon]|nr:MAG: ATP-grasp domain-containing protein [archaeon]
MISEIDGRLGRRKLIWFGIRGADAVPLLELQQFREVFSIIAPLQSLSVERETCLENMKKERPDLDRYSVDDDTTIQASEFRRALFEALSEPSAVVPYTTGGFITAAYYPRWETTEYLGLFNERREAFTYKPWVESELVKLGVPTVPWRYVKDEDRTRLIEALELGPVVVRTSRTDGGVGVGLIHDKKGLSQHLPDHADGFIAVAPFLHPNIPLNVNACVFKDGTVSLHSPSLQLIGVPSCTSRTFGYCGNDFARIRELPANILDSLEEIVLKTGRWLASVGYLGAFGVDAIVHDAKVLLAEVNPRFQGSSALSASLDAELDRPDVFLCHIASFQGLTPPPIDHLRDLASSQGRVSQVIIHNCTPSTLERTDNGTLEGPNRYLIVPQKGIGIKPNAVLAKVYVDESVTQDGLSLSPEYRKLTEGFSASHFSKSSSRVEASS